ncbi:MAG: hypothetical protein ACREAK_08845 [Nitrosarchaeum sp.]
MLENFFQSNIFVIGYYILTGGSSLRIKETKKRIDDLKIGISSIKYALIPFGILFAYVILAHDFVETIPILNWSWFGYSIAFSPFADQGFWGIIPFIPLLVYMFIHINYVEEVYFRKSKKMVWYEHLSILQWV